MIDARRKRTVLIAAILGSGIVFLDGTIVNVALPAIRASLHGGLAEQQWVVEAYLLTLSAPQLAVLARPAPVRAEISAGRRRARLHAVALPKLGCAAINPSSSLTPGIFLPTFGIRTSRNRLPHQAAGKI